MKINLMPSFQRLSDLLSYEPETGVVAWRINRSNVKKGAIVSTVEGAGYLQVAIDGRTYKAHRVAWMLFHGCEPDGQVDHINGDRTDNRIINLRLASHGENCRNSRVRSQSGFKGVSFDKDRNKYFASIKFDGKQRNLGRYRTAEEAARAYDTAAANKFGDFARLNFKPAG